MRGIRIQHSWPVLFAMLALAGCGAGGGSGGQTPASTAHRLGGQVHGGQFPVTGSTVTVYAAGSSSGAATSLGSTTTDSGGNWSITTLGSCPAVDTPVYVVASGGNPGLAAGTNNTAIHLMAALGPCNALPAAVNIDEITTVAAAYALYNFNNLTNEDDVSGSDATSLAKGFSIASQLADPTTGRTPTALATGNATTQKTINALANAMAACINTTDAGSAPCVELFDCSLTGAAYATGDCSGGSGTAATDTLGALLQIAGTPGVVSIAGVFNTAGRNVVFSPTLSAAPNDWAIGINITDPSLNSPHGLAIDGSGNVWVSNNGNNSLSEFSPLGQFVASYTGGGLNQPGTISIDGSGTVWVLNGNNTYSEFSNAGVPAARSPFSGGLVGALDITIDLSGNIWIPNYYGDTVSAFAPDGTAAAGSPYGTVGSGPAAIAIDASHKVWISDSTSSTVAALDNTGTPLSGSPFSGGGLNAPHALAVDPSGNIWIANNNSSLTKLSSTGTAISTTTGYTGGGLTNDPYAMVIDSGGEVFTTGSFNSVSDFNNTGGPLSPATGFTAGQIATPTAIAVDSTGNIWTANPSSNSLTLLVGIAFPTVTPVVSAIGVTSSSTQ